MSTITDTSAAPSAVGPTAVEPAAFPINWSIADLQNHLGGIPLERIRLYPAPGTATEEDALRLDDHEDCICELVDGVLVEKTMGFNESILAVLLARLIGDFAEKHNLGVVSGADGQIRILPKRMRIPDIAFIPWARFPDGRLPKDRVCKFAPDLAVEVISEGNTSKEMELKLDEYFEAGVRMVWYIDPATRTARIYTTRENSTTIDSNGLLDGGDVLPGFQLRLGELFERAERRKEK